MITGAIFFLTVSCFQFYARAASTLKDPDAIKFPGPLKDYNTENRFGSDASHVPDECKDLVYCTLKPKNYPQEKINKLFKGTNTMSVTPELILPDDFGIADKQGDPEDRDDCESVVTYEPLYKVRSKRGDWMTVVQSPEKNFVQKVRMETCSNTGGPCFLDFSAPPTVTAPFCKQKYNTWQFVVLDGDQYSNITVDLPVCCSCYYKPASIILNRFGKNKN